MNAKERSVEFLLARDDGTWTTEVLQVPSVGLAKYSVCSPKWVHAVTVWAQNEVMTKTQYRGVVFCGIYDTNSEEEEDGS